jgi:hypothetical protein
VTSTSDLGALRSRTRSRTPITVAAGQAHSASSAALLGGGGGGGVMVGSGRQRTQQAVRLMAIAPELHPRTERGVRQFRRANGIVVLGGLEDENFVGNMLDWTRESQVYVSRRLPVLLVAHTSQCRPSGEHDAALHKLHAATSLPVIVVNLAASSACVDRCFAALAEWMLAREHGEEYPAREHWPLHGHFRSRNSQSGCIVGGAASSAGGGHSRGHTTVAAAAAGSPAVTAAGQGGSLLCACDDQDGPPSVECVGRTRSHSFGQRRRQHTASSAQSVNDHEYWSQMKPKKRGAGGLFGTRRRRHKKK